MKQTTLKLPKKIINPSPAGELIQSPKLISEKEQRKLDNTKINAEKSAHKEVQFKKTQPLVHAYFSRKLIFQESVLIDGIECFRPLMIGASKIVFQHLRAQIEDCSNVLLRNLMKESFISHCEKPKYIYGLLKFNERFDLDGNAVGKISEKEKIMAIKKAKRRGIRIDDSNKAEGSSQATI